MPQARSSVPEEQSFQRRTDFRGSRRKRPAVIGAIAVVGLLIGIVVLARHWPFSRERIIQDLQDDFHGTIAVRNFRITIFPHPGCVAEGVTLISPGQPPGSVPLVSADKLTIRAHYLDFLLRPGHVSHIDVAGLQIHIPLRGTLADTPRNEKPSTTRVGEVIANDAILEVARKSAKPLRFELHKVTLNSVSRKDGFSYDATFLNALPPGEIQSRGHFGPWNSDDPGQTPVSGTYKFEHAYLGVFGGIDGVLSSHDSFQGTLAQMETRGSVDIPDFKVRRASRSVPIESRFHAFVNALNGDVSLEHVQSAIAKSNVLARGSVEKATGTGKVTSLELNSSNGRIEDILRVFIKEPKSPIVGAISFRAHVTVPPHWSPFEKQVMLVADFGIDDSRFTKPETQKKVNNLSERAQGKKVDDKEQKREEDSDDEGDWSRTISDLKGHVVLKNGVATLTDIAFSVPGATAYMHGTFNLANEKLDFHGVLQTQAEFTKVGGGGIKSIFLKPLDAVFKKKPKGAEIPVKMTGTYSHPEFGLEITGGKKADQNKK